MLAVELKTKDQKTRFMVSSFSELMDKIQIDKLVLLNAIKHGGLVIKIKGVKENASES